MLNFLTTEVLTHLIAAVIAADLLAQPTLTGDQRETEVEGDVKHAIRVLLDQKINAGWLVDVLWDVAPFVANVQTIIQQQIAALSLQPAAQPAAS